MNNQQVKIKDAKAVVRTLRSQLAHAQQRLDRIETWLKYVTIGGTLATAFGALVGGYVALSQRDLLKAQALEATEKQRVAFRFRLTPVLLPERKSFYVRAIMRNLSVRRLTVLMLTIRAWQGEKWEYNRPVKDHQGELIISDNLVSELGKGWKNPDQKNLKLHELAEGITLESTEEDSEETFGPYSIEEAQLNRGFWLMGRLYVAETERGMCKINTQNEPTPGTLPSVYEPKCKPTPEDDCTACSVAIAPATYYSSTKTERLIQSGEK